MECHSRLFERISNFPQLIWICPETGKQVLCLSHFLPDWRWDSQESTAGLDDTSRNPGTIPRHTTGINWESVPRHEFLVWLNLLVCISKMQLQWLQVTPLSFMSFHFSRAKESNHTNLFKHCYGHIFGHNLSPRKNGFRWKSMEILCWQNSTNQDKNTYIRTEDLCETLGRQDGTRDLTRVLRSSFVTGTQPKFTQAQLVLWTYRIRVFSFSFFRVRGNKKFKFSFQFLGLVGLICLINQLNHLGKKIAFFLQASSTQPIQGIFQSRFQCEGKIQAEDGKAKKPKKFFAFEGFATEYLTFGF